MKPLKLLLTIAVAFIIILLVCPFTYHFFIDDTEEIAMRLHCSCNQSDIYAALEKYYLEHNTLPQTLTELVEASYLDEDKLYCPTARRYSHLRCYHYYPENYAKHDKVLIGEDSDNHSMKGWRRRTIPPAVNEIMGDGTIRRRNPATQEHE